MRHSGSLICPIAVMIDWTLLVRITFLALLMMNNVTMVTTITVMAVHPPAKSSRPTHAVTVFTAMEIRTSPSFGVIPVVAALVFA
jgi:hypothetical protein